MNSITDDFLNEFAEEQGLLTIDDIRKQAATGNTNNPSTANVEQSVADEKEYQEIIELAKVNVLDRAVIEYATKFNNLSDFGYFFDEIFEFAESQNKKTVFQKRMNDIKKIVKANQKRAEQQERLEKRAEKQQELPDWIYLDRNDRAKVNEDIYIKRFLEQYPLKYTNGTFFDYAGEKRDGEILKLIQEDENLGIRKYVLSGLARVTSNIFSALKNSVYIVEIIPDMKQIHFSNGILSADKNGLFTNWENGSKEIYINNLSCTYKPNAKEPKKFLSFLKELLFDDDIVTLHEWLGYLLLPTNTLQEAIART